MTKQITKISAILFVGVFVLTVAFTITAGSAEAGDPCAYGACCEVMTPDGLKKGWEFYDVNRDACGCACGPHPIWGSFGCELLCPDPR